MVSDIFEGVLEFVFHVIIEVTFFYTGELILFIITFGQKKPRLDYYATETPTKWALFTELSVWLGFFFWVFTIGWAVRTFF